MNKILSVWVIFIIILLPSSNYKNWVEEFNCKNDYNTKCQLMSLCWAYDYPNDLYKNKSQCEIEEYNSIKSNYE